MPSKTRSRCHSASRTVGTDRLLLRSRQDQMSRSPEHGPAIPSTRQVAVEVALLPVVQHFLERVPLEPILCFTKPMEPSTSRFTPVPLSIPGLSICCWEVLAHWPSTA